MVSATHRPTAGLYTNVVAPMNLSFFFFTQLYSAFTSLRLIRRFLTRTPCQCTKTVKRKIKRLLRFTKINCFSQMSDTRIDGDWHGVEDPWISSSIDLVALQDIVCQVLRVPASQCGPPVAIGLEESAQYARVYSFQLPNRTVVARVVAPVKPLFKTESEVAAMDFVRSKRLYGYLPSSLRMMDDRRPHFPACPEGLRILLRSQ